MLAIATILLLDIFIEKTMKKDKPNHAHSLIIDELGGTAKVAKIFSIRNPSVSKWRKTGIPSARMMYLKKAYPKVFRLKKQ